VLLALTQKGMSREDAYRAVQRNAMAAWQGTGAFRNLLKADREIGQFLANDEIDALFDLNYHLKHVDTVFKRVFGAA
jgi:adenylosuccinate lyase